MAFSSYDASNTRHLTTHISPQTHHRRPPDAAPAALGASSRGRVGTSRHHERSAQSLSAPTTKDVHTRDITHRQRREIVPAGQGRKREATRNRTARESDILQKVYTEMPIGFGKLAGKIYGGSWAAVTSPTAKQRLPRRPRGPAEQDRITRPVCMEETGRCI